MSFPIEYQSESPNYWVVLSHKKIEISSKQYILIFTSHKNENKSQIILMVYKPFEIDRKNEEKEKEKEREKEKEKKTYFCVVETKMTKKKADSVLLLIENNTSTFEYSKDDDHFLLSLGLQDFVLENKNLLHIDQYYETIVIEEKFKEYQNQIEFLLNENKQMKSEFAKNTTKFEETIEHLSQENKKLKIENKDLKEKVNNKKKKKEKEKEKEIKKDGVNNFLRGSMILDTEKENHLGYCKTLQKWLQNRGFNSNLKLRYSTDIHGWSNRVFHNKCDKKGKSLTLIKLKNGSLFGGYADGDWWSPPRSGTFFNTQNQNSFIFSLRSKNNNRKPLIFKRRLRQGSFELTTNKDYGPIWGGGKGYDLLLNFDEPASCFSALGYSYWSDEILSQQNQSTTNYLSGTTGFWEFQSIEVFCEF
ncbi:pep-cterm sorting domain-containing protein [Anaeramoeba flamelloides]|uniref:Pep-cterm sorting domain-containing protein n=1 Tax=Anaeramoeba flamelloides TaxID=1746091 RepID=A0AAV8A9B8_9EUKA|nr:pep-cterm sorting domain-containing protein [Anaeramoeba flamelloides]